MAEKMGAKSQILVLYQTADGYMRVYDSAYDDRQVEEAIERCEDEHGFDSMPKAVEGLIP